MATCELVSVRCGECMPEADSKELRNRIVQTYEVGEGEYAANGIRFSVSAPTVFRWVRLYRSSGDIAPKPKAGGLGQHALFLW